MFLLEKFISNLLISPALFIIIVLLGALLMDRFNYARFKKLFIIISVGFYLISIRPTKELLVRVIEPKKISSPAEIRSSEVYVLLGGGITQGTPVGSIPTDAAYSRIVEAATLYKKYPKKIIVTGGRVYDRESPSESSVYRSVLAALGVPEEDIILEEESRNTLENAILTKKILDEMEVSSITLITSATHMFRAKTTFTSTGLQVATSPTGYLTDNSSYKVQDFIPSSRNLDHFLRALWEYVGIAVYQVQILIRRYSS